MAALKRTVQAVISASLLCAAFGMAWAQVKPVKPIRIVVPFSPGGAADILARVLGQRLTESWGQQVVREAGGRADEHDSG